MRRKDCILQWGINENLMIFERGKSQANNEEKKDVVKIDIFLSAEPSSALYVIPYSSSALFIFSLQSLVSNSLKPLSTEELKLLQLFRL